MEEYLEFAKEIAAEAGKIMQKYLMRLYLILTLIILNKMVVMNLQKNFMKKHSTLLNKKWVLKILYLQLCTQMN